MKIIRARAYLRNLRLLKPYTIARQRIEDVENVFLELELENGMVGIGAANPSPEVVGESPADSLDNLNDGLTDWLTGKDIRQFNTLINEVKLRYPQRPGTWAAVDIALHDAFGQWLGMPVADFYGRFHLQLPTSVTIGIMDLQQTLEEAKAFERLGFRVLKLKTGISPEEDAEKIIRLREQHGQQMTIRVDANTGYDLAMLQEFLVRVRGYGVELIEQPLLPENDAALDVLPAADRALLAADESLHDAAAAFRLCSTGRYGIYNVKLMKCGGIKGALEIAAVTAPAGASLFWGCNDESIVSITAALHAAFACPHTRYIDLDGSFDLAEDVVSGGFVVKDGLMSIVPGAGLGLIRLAVV